MGVYFENSEKPPFFIENIDQKIVNDT